MALGVLGMSSHRGQVKAGLEPFAKVSNHIIVMKHTYCVLAVVMGVLCSL